MGEVEADLGSISPNLKNPRHAEDSEPHLSLSPSDPSSNTPSILTNVATITPDSQHSRVPSCIIRSDSFSSQSSTGSSPRIGELRTERNVKLGILVERLRTSQSNLSPTASPECQLPLKSSSSSPDLKARSEVFDHDESSVKPSKLEQIRAKRQQKLNETQQKLAGISNKMHTVSSVPDMAEHLRHSISSPSQQAISAGMKHKSEDLDKLLQNQQVFEFEPANTDRLRSQHQKLMNDIQKQLSSIPEPTPTKSNPLNSIKRNEDDGLRGLPLRRLQSGPVKRESTGVRSLENIRRQLSYSQKASQRHLNSLLQHHGYFDTPKMQELRRKRDQAQQHMMTMVSNSCDVSPKSLHWDDRKTEGSSDHTFDHLSKLDQLRMKRAQNYDKALMELASFGDNSREVTAPQQSSGESSAPKQTQPEERQRQQQQQQIPDGALGNNSRESHADRTKLQQALVHTKAELQMMRKRTESTGTADQMESMEYEIEDDHDAEESELCQIIDDLQQQVEKLQDEQTTQKVRLESELHESRIQAQLVEENYEEAQLCLTQLKQESANMHSRHERQRVRFASTTQLWRHRADGLLEQVRELHLALQDQTQMRMIERIDFIRHIALLEKENHELKNGQRRRQRPRKAPSHPNRFSVFSFIPSPFQSFFGLEMYRTQRASNRLLVWHPMKSTSKGEKKRKLSFSLRGLAQRGSGLLSSETLKGAVQGFGFMGLALMADPSHASQESRLFLRSQLPAPSFTRLWHPMKSTSKKGKKRKLSFSLRGMAQRGSGLLSSEMLKGAVWGLGFMCMVLMADPSHASQDSRLLLRFELPAPSFTRR
jgi:hypothetical protein